MKRWPVLGLALAVLWLFVRGVESSPSAVAGEFLIGLAVGVPTAYVFRRFYRATVDVPARLAGVPYAVVYLVLFVKELVTANVDVAYRVLHPSLPIEPDVIELPLRVESDVGITTIANSITLTPGTLTMDYDEERNALYVHAIAGRDRAAVVDPIRSWENYALRIFDEERDPSDPVPVAPASERGGVTTPDGWASADGTHGTDETDATDRAVEPDGAGEGDGTAGHGASSDDRGGEGGGG